MAKAPNGSGATDFLSVINAVDPRLQHQRQRTTALQDTLLGYTSLGSTLGGRVRRVPIFPVLRPYPEDALAWALAEPGAEFDIADAVHRNTKNLGTILAGYLRPGCPASRRERRRGTPRMPMQDKAKRRKPLKTSPREHRLAGAEWAIQDLNL